MMDKECMDKMDNLEGINIERLKDVTEIIMGQSPPSDTYNKDKIGLPFFQGKAEFGAIFPQVKIYCSNPKKVAKKNDILMSVRAPVGSVNIADTECCIGRGLCAIRGSDNIDYMYLYYFLKTNEVRISSKGTGSIFTAIDKKNIQELKIPVPPIREQRKIVDKLNKQLAQIEMMKNEAEKTQTAIFSYNHSFINRLVEVEDCKEVLFGELVEEFKYGSSEKASNPNSKSVPILRIPNIIGKVIDLTDLKYIELDDEEKGLFLKGGDILFVRTNGNPHNIGRCSLFDLEDDKYVFASYLIRARVKMDKVVPEFIDILFKSGNARDALLSKAKTSAGNYNINTVSLRNIRLRIPSIEVQNQIVAKYNEFLDTHKKSMGYVNVEFDAINQLPASILNEVFGQYQINS
ncbi:MAG: restriction endonuclease subunit S [Candidatus Methanoperedens sp.]|nr:restriction endonuclease subunit S [Candidatus Methanoperedens sp.]